MARSDRYEDQNWLIRRLRDTYMVLAPIYAVRFWLHEILRPYDGPDDYLLSFHECWCLGKAIVNVKQRNIGWIERIPTIVVDIEESDC